MWYIKYCVGYVFLLILMACAINHYAVSTGSPFTQFSISLCVAIFISCFVHLFELMIQLVDVSNENEDLCVIVGNLICKPFTYMHHYISHNGKVQNYIDNEITERFLINNSFYKNISFNCFIQRISVNDILKSEAIIKLNPIDNTYKQTIDAEIKFYDVYGKMFLRRVLKHVHLNKKEFFEILTNAHDLKIDVLFHTTYNCL